MANQRQTKTVQKLVSCFPSCFICRRHLLCPRRCVCNAVMCMSVTRIIQVRTEHMHLKLESFNIYALLIYSVWEYLHDFLWLCILLSQVFQIWKMTHYSVLPQECKYLNTSVLHSKLSIRQVYFAREIDLA